MLLPSLILKPSYLLHDLLVACEVVEQLVARGHQLHAGDDEVEEPTDGNQELVRGELGRYLNGPQQSGWCREGRAWHDVAWLHSGRSGYGRGKATA